MTVDRILSAYLLSLGIFLITIAAAEFIAPRLMFLVWGKWVRSRWFFLHGLILIIMGFPLTQYDSPANPIIAKIIFGIGLIIVFTGPFVLLYPGNVRKVVTEFSDLMGERGIRRFIYVDAALRLAAGTLFVCSYFL
jgi:hypothetical protein